MQTIHVAKPFVLTLKDGNQRTFDAGRHEVEDHIAEHWYVQANAKAVPADAPKLVTLVPATDPLPPAPAPASPPPKIPVPPTHSKK